MTRNYISVAAINIFYILQIQRKVLQEGYLNECVLDISEKTGPCKYSDSSDELLHYMQKFFFFFHKKIGNATVWKRTSLV